MGEKRDAAKPGYAYVKALIRLLDETGAHELKMSGFGVKQEDFAEIADMTVNQVGISMDRYPLTVQDFIEILQDSYR